MIQFPGSVLDWLIVLLDERYGLKFSIIQRNHALEMALHGSGQKIIFDKLEPAFHESCSNFSCDHWNAEREGFIGPVANKIPAPASDRLPLPLVEQNTDGAVVHYDILGLAYWSLTRLEEVDRVDLDGHQRFPAKNSHAFAHNYLSRPIVDEWLDVLGQIIKLVWPSIKLKGHGFRINVSHDVDAPSLYSYKSWCRIARIMLGNILLRQDIRGFFQAPYIRLTARSSLHSLDPFNVFDWLMDVSEKNGLESSFYFICGGDDRHDAEYHPDDELIRRLMRKIFSRGHRIGLHPSYQTFNRPALIEEEAGKLKSICELEGIKQDTWGSRMHYLRWSQPTTMQALTDAGLSYDATLGYADRPGFRCGTCFEYPAFNPVTKLPLNLRIRPLIAMDCSIVDSAYLGLGISSEAEKHFLELKETCRAVNGVFTLLWHNSYFESSGSKEMYRTIIERQ